MNSHYVVDRRDVRRNAVVLPVRFAHAGKMVQAATRDISPGGAFIETARVVPVGQCLQLGLLHPFFGGGVYVTCRVTRHASAGNGMGVCFVEWPPDGTARTRLFLGIKCLLRKATLPTPFTTNGAGLP